MSAKARYALWVTGASLLYAVVVVGAAWIVRHGGLGQPVQIVVALVPIVPGAVMVWAYIRQVNAMDEFLRKIQLDSLAIAAAGTAFLTLGYGSLEAAGFPKLSMFYVAPLLVSIWSVANIVQLLRQTRDASGT